MKKQWIAITLALAAPLAISMAETPSYGRYEPAPSYEQRGYGRGYCGGWQDRGNYDRASDSRSARPYCEGPRGYSYDARGNESSNWDGYGCPGWNNRRGGYCWER